MAIGYVDKQQYEKLNPQTGLVEKLPALNPVWCTDVTFLPFTPPIFIKDDGCSQQWVESLEAIDTDLHDLLRFPHHKFWSQALHDKTLCRLLDTYLQHAPRPYERVWSLPTGCQETMRNVHKRIFLTFLRLSTHKENKDHQITPVVFGELIYNHFIFDIPRILDLCSIYGDTNTQLLNKMINNIFDKQPHYWQDLTQAIKGIVEILTKLNEKCISSDDSSSLRLDSADMLNPSEVSDLVLYLADISHTLKSLVLVYPPTCHTLWETGLTEKLIMFYESSVPVLQSQWKYCSDHTEYATYITHRLRQAKKDITTLVHDLLMSCCHDDSEAKKEESESVDRILSLCTLLTTEKIFLKEFEKHHSLRECLKLIKQSHPSFDDTQLQYILAAVGGETTPHKRKEKGNKGEVQKQSISDKIKYIRELLPHLEEEFIKVCLSEFNQDPQIVIDRILEGTLPPHLQSYDETHPSLLNDAGIQETKQINSRVGIFDFDEFDVLHKNDVDLKHIHIGKRYETAQDILSDRSHVPFMKGRGLDLIPEYDEYDDEYDDTYDSHNVGATDQDSADEMTAVKRLNEKGQFSSHHMWEDEENDNKGTSIEPIMILKRPEGLKRGDHPPMKKPEEKSTSRHNKGGRDQYGAGRGNKRVELHQEDPKPTKQERKDQRQQDDKEPRGGVSKQSEQKSYQSKERHKSSRANHNRRVIADKKRRGF